MIFGCQAVPTIGGGEAGTNCRGPVVRSGTRDPTVLRMYFSFSVESLFVDLQLNPFRRSPIHSAFDSQPLRCSVNILASPPLLGGRGSLGPEPAHSGPGVRLQGLKTSVKFRPHLSFANRNFI